MNIFDYNDFLINEAVVSLSNDVLSKLLKTSLLLDEREQEWIDKIINVSGEDISSDKLDDKNAYYFDLTDDPKYFNMEVHKPKPLAISTQTFKVGRVFKIMVPDIPADVLSNIVSALQSAPIANIKVVEDYDIIKYYTYNASTPNDISPEGTIGKSCMNNKDNEFFYLYSKNKGIVKLAILLDEYETLIARALIWKTDLGWVMDRVYYSSDKYLYQFKDWAKHNGYLYSSDIENDGHRMEIQLNEVKFKYYPYLDTFKYICFNKKQLSNYDIFDDDDEVAYLNSTEGSFELVRNCKNRFIALNSLSEYEISDDLVTFIDYSINYEKWLNAIISDDIDYYSDEPEDFLDSYYSYIIDKFNELNLKEIDKDINKDNIREMILRFKDSYVSKYDDIVDKVINLKYSKEGEYRSWKDWHDEIYGEGAIPYFKLRKSEKEFYENFIMRFCELEILNDKLRELYNSDYDSYLEFMAHLGY